MHDDKEVPKAQLYVDQKAWQWRLQGGNQINVQVCPLCKNSNWKFFVNKENGLWDCKVCGRNGNLHELAREMGDSLDRMSGVVSNKDALGGGKQAGSLPDIERMHKALLAHDDAMEYLTYERGFSDTARDREDVPSMFGR